MPRLSPKLFHRAGHIHPLLPLVLRSTRDLTLARNELRWLKEHALSGTANGDQRGWQNAFKKLCLERGRGRPLQYLLGTEYFGDLEIICRPGVLIPRQETAASITYLAKRLVKLPDALRVLDLCTGTGCIPLLFQYELQRSHRSHNALHVLGIDVSPKAVRLAQENLEHQQKDSMRPLPVEFAKADVLADDQRANSTTAPSLESALREYNGAGKTLVWDILLSNPPYISPEAFDRTTSRSVRTFEPRLALVPEEHLHISDVHTGDTFYPRLLEIAKEMQSKMILFEVADMDQAQRVAKMMLRQGLWTRIEIWRDDPEHHDGSLSEGPEDDLPGVKLLGSGHGRSVFAWRDDACEWLGISATA